MSILLADAARSAANNPLSPATPTTQPGEVPPWLAVLLLSWLVTAVVAVWRAGVLRRRSIVGPERLAAGDSAWWLLGVFFAAYCVGIFAASIANAFLKVDGTIKLLALTLVLEGVAVSVLLLGMQRMRGGLAPLGMTARQSVRGVAGGLLCLFILFPIVFAVSELTIITFRWAHLPEPKAHEILQSLGELKNLGLIALNLLAAVVIAPLFEELAFRAVLQTALVRMFGWLAGGGEASPPARWLAVVVSAGAFAAVHGQWAFAPPLFVLALGLGYAYERTANLWVTITAHALFNSMQIILYFLVVEG